MKDIRVSLKLTSELVRAYVAHNPVPANDIEKLLRAVHHAFDSLAAGEPEPTPAIAIKASVTNDYLVCLEDGKRLKMLKRYLRTHHGMTPEEYRVKWNLPHNYPMTAPAYTARRSVIAKKIGLGRKSSRPRRRQR